MDSSPRRYTPEEVSGIVRRALESAGSGDTIGHEDLLEIAKQSGISQDRLEAAVLDQETLGELEEAKVVWTKRRRDKFYRHLRSYLIVNGILFVLNLVTNPGSLWVIWPILGWGFGLAFDASDTFFVTEERLKRGAKRVLRAREKRREDLREIY